MEQRRRQPKRGRDDAHGGGDRGARAGRAGARGASRGAAESRQDRRPEQRRPRVPEPQLPADVTGDELDRAVRADLRSLSKDGASAVARHLVMVARLLDDDPEAAWQHAQAAQRRAGRIGVVREAAGLAAYRAAHYEEALRELRTARRLTGSDVHLPVMADCERGLGRPERALALASSAAAARLEPAEQAEMRIVAAGARIDMGNPQAAVLLLQPLAQKVTAQAPWRARVYSAYADALEAAGRNEEARAWLERAAAADTTGDTGAYERLVGDVDSPVVVDLLEDEEPGVGSAAAVRPEHQA